MKADYVIENFEPINAGNLKGSFDVILASGLRINNCRLFARPNGARWIAFPAKKITDAAGKITWKEHVEIRDPGILRVFRDGVLKAIDGMGGEQFACRMRGARCNTYR